MDDLESPRAAFTPYVKEEKTDKAVGTSGDCLSGDRRKCLAVASRLSVSELVWSRNSGTNLRNKFLKVAHTAHTEVMPVFKRRVRDITDEDPILVELGTGIREQVQRPYIDRVIVAPWAPIILRGPPKYNKRATMPRPLRHGAQFD